MPLEAIEVVQGVVFSQALAGALEDVVVENETSLIDVAVVLGSTSERFKGGSDAAPFNSIVTTAVIRWNEKHVSE